ncbi:hypothetical protein [Coxiella-like endosymbiont]|nr:hypothetical protein [Coxiella-like endosymbiont]
MSHLAEVTLLSRKDVSAVLEELANVMHRHLRKGGMPVNLLF